MRLGERKKAVAEFGDLFMPDEAAEPILARPVRNALLEWLVEIGAAEKLKAVGVKPRKRAVFDGPPGVGKTTLAHHLAARLGLPMLAVRPERMGSKYVSEAGSNVGDLFDAAAAGLERADGERVPVVLFLDEFDSMARQRRGPTSAADDERNEVVNVLLQRIEQHDGYLIAATNAGGELDTAIWRRFDLHITLQLPGPEERRAILARYLRPFGLPTRPLAELADALEGASPALMRSLCEDLKRQIVVGPELKQDMAKGAVIERVLASRNPHPKLGKPRLWSHGASDRAVQVMPWPLPSAEEARAAPTPGAAEADNVVTLRGRP